MRPIHTTAVLTLALLAGAPYALAQAVPYAGFAKPIFIRAGVNPSHVLPIDVDGDGDMDLVVANMGKFDAGGFNTDQFPPSIQVFMNNGPVFANNGQGGLMLSQKFNNAANGITQPLQIVKMDINNDGLLDVVVADGASRGVQALLRDPILNGLQDPIFSKIVVPPSPSGADLSGDVRSLDLGDLNGDLIPDVVTPPLTNHLLSQPSVFRAFGVGDGHFIQTARFLGVAPFSEPQYIKFGNFVSFDTNGNPIPGTEFRGVATANTLLLIGDPNGSFSIAKANATGDFIEANTVRTKLGYDLLNGPFMMRFANVGADAARLDMLAPANQFSTSGTNDYNGWGVFIALDGRYTKCTDPVKCPPNTFDFDNTVFIPTSTVRSGTPIPMYDAPRPFALAVGDVNMDGKPDLVITHGGPFSPLVNDDIDLSVMLNTSADPQTTTPTFEHFGVIGQGSAPALPFRFTAIDEYGHLGTADEPRVYPHYVELADIDNDGDLDIITTRSRKAHITTTGGSNPDGADSTAILPQDPNGEPVRFIAANGVALDDYIVIFENLAITSPCGPTDLNGDGVVDAVDLSIVLNNLGLTCTDPAAPCPGDATGDGVVDGADFALVLNNIGCGVPAAATSGSGALTTSTSGAESVMAKTGSAYGFSSVDAYIAWLESLTPDELVAHIRDLIKRLTK